MSATALGNNLTTAVTGKNSPEIRTTENGTEYVYRKVQKKGTAIGISFGTANPDSSFSSTVLKGINYIPQPGGGYETIELVYADPVTGSPGTPPVGTIIQETDSNMIELPIQQHPGFSSGSSTYDDAGNLITPYVTSKLLPGVTSFLSPQPTYTRTEMLSSFTFSEANIISNVGKRQAPTGMTSATAAKWLKTRLSIRKIGKVVEKSESWQYAQNDWESVIYADA